MLWEVERLLDISIHAPTRGATGRYIRLCYNLLYFNPRSHKGSDINSDCDRAYQQAFQSTLPQGERPLVSFLSSSANTNFNPRSHKGSDFLFVVVFVSPYVISIHAPTRGATLIARVTDPSTTISIHAPTRGATVCKNKTPTAATVFQSTLPQGERLGN